METLRNLMALLTIITYFPQNSSFIGYRNEIPSMKIGETNFLASVRYT